MSKGSKPNYNKGDYRPNASEKGPHSKPIYNAADYRPGFGFEGGKGEGKGGKGKKKAKIWRYSRRLAPGATQDPWHGAGR